LDALLIRLIEQQTGNPQSKNKRHMIRTELQSGSLMWTVCTCAGHRASWGSIYGNVFPHVTALDRWC